MVLTEPTDWIGGQLTSQAVPPDEHPWIEQFGRNARYQALRQGIRDYYRRHYPLTAEAAGRPVLEPGPGRRLAALPRAESRAGGADGDARAARVGGPTARPAGARAGPGRGRRRPGASAVIVRDRKTGDERTLVAPYFLDATELGDLLAHGRRRVRHRGGGPGPDRRAACPGRPASRCPAGASPAASPWITSKARTTRSTDPPSTISGATTFPSSSRPGRASCWTCHYCRSDHAQAGQPRLRPEGRGQGALGLPPDRRPAQLPSRGVSRSKRHHPGELAAERLLAGPAGRAGCDAEEAERHIARAKQLSLSLLYWLQTECPRPDGKTGWKGLRLRPDLVGTEDGLAKAPYIRESRRIQAEFTVLEQHVGTEARRKKLGKTDVAAEPFPDRVGVGWYRIDLHPSTGGVNYIDISSLPFQIPAGCA